MSSSDDNTMPMTTTKNHPPSRFDTDISTSTTATTSSSSNLLSSSTCSSFAVSTNDNNDNDEGKITILGFGSLLSERSAKTTFPSLTSFRLGRVPNHRRIFGHPASIFFERGIAEMDTLQISSLCAEYCEGCSFVCSVFEVPNDGMMIMDESSGDSSSSDSNGGVEGDLIPSRAFLEREEEFDIVMVPYQEEGSEKNIPDENITNNKKGILCRKSTDEAYISRWGQSHFEKQYKKYGIDTIWGWDESSGIKPCGPYLRHCVLAAEKMGDECLDSFLDETYLVDRKTTIREYLEEYPDVMKKLPPSHLAERYGG